MTSDKHDDCSRDAAAIPYALLRYTFVGFHRDFDTHRGCHCHPESTHYHAVFEIEKNLTRDQVIERLAIWNRDHPNEESHVLMTIIAEDRSYVQGNTSVFGDEVAFDARLIDKADGCAMDISNIEDDARDRCLVLIEEARAAAEVSKRKAEEEKKARADAARQQVEKQERELLTALKVKYGEK